MDEQPVGSAVRNPIKDRVASVVLNHCPRLTLLMAGSDGAGFDVAVRHDHIEIAEKHGDRAIRIARSVAAYLPDMIRHFDYYFGSTTPVDATRRGGNRRLVDFSTPRFHEVTGFADFPVLCPAMTEPYVTAQQYVEFAQLREGDSVIDLGGYSGLTSIAFSKRVGPRGKVIVLEPDPANFRAARTNFDYHRRINGIDNIVLLPFAIAGRRGSLDFSAEGSMGSADASIIGGFRGAVIQVEAVTLEDLVDRTGLTTVAFVKMDIEGAEESVLAVSGNFFRKHAPKIIVEPHVVAGASSERGVRSLLSGFGYECRSIAQTGLTLPLVTGTPRRA